MLPYTRVFLGVTGTTLLLYSQYLDYWQWRRRKQIESRGLSKNHDKQKKKKKVFGYVKLCKKKDFDAY